MRSLVIVLLFASVASANPPGCYKCYPQTYYPPAPAAALPPPYAPNFDTAVINTMWGIGKLHGEANKLRVAGEAINQMTYGLGAAAYAGPSVAAPGAALYSSSEYFRGYGEEQVSYRARAQSLDPHVMATQRNTWLRDAASLNREINQQTTEDMRLEFEGNLEKEKLGMLIDGILKSPRGAAVPQGGRKVTQYGAAQYGPANQLPPPAPVFGSAGPAGAAQGIAVLQSRCTKCHSPGSVNGGIDLTQALTFNPEVKEKVRTAIWDKQMPVKKIGEEYEYDPLTPAEASALLALFN